MNQSTFDANQECEAAGAAAGAAIEAKFCAVKLQAAGNIIMETSLELLAHVHGRTVDEVAAGLRAGNVKLLRQFRECVERGADEAVRLAKQGRINFN